MGEAGASGTASSRDAARIPSPAEGGRPEAIDEDDDLRGDQEAGGFERLTLPQVLRAVQRTALPIPIQNPALLPLYQLDPEVLERLAAEVVSHRNNLGTHFYGRRGQKQHGLDIVELETDSNSSLYQVKRYETLSAKQMDDIVEEYAGPPRPVGYVGPKRRFDPHRFVIVTSAPVESDTGNVDGLKDLQDAYQGDLTIEVWGAEALGRKLRDAPHAVLAIFGTPWAKAWCGFEPAPAPPGTPQALGLVEGPVSVLNLDAMEADAAARQAADPLGAAALYGSVAQGLQDGNFPGHAAAMRRRQADAAEAGGDHNGAFAILFRLGLDRVLVGEDFVFGALRHKLTEMSASLSGVQQDKLVVLGAIADWYERGSQLGTTVPALTRLVGSADPDSAVLICLVIEQALVDGLYDHVPAYSVVTGVDADSADLLRDLTGLAAASDTRDVVIRARLRCATADAALPLARVSNDLEEPSRIASGVNT